MSSDFLNDIVAYKKKLIAKKRSFYDLLKKNTKETSLTRYGLFKKEISKPGRMNLIAEIKKASPSKGLIVKDFDVTEIAKIYQDHPVEAISVLTEDKYFLGKPSYLKRVSDQSSVPTLMKDFVIDEGQIYESFICGASAILLIVAILQDQHLIDFIRVANSLDVDCLVEVHDQPELDRALRVGANIIGINNRNLHTFEASLDVSRSLIPQIPKNKVIVSESGIKTHDDILSLQSMGANAVLVGETFMRAADIGAKIRDVMQGD